MTDSELAGRVEALEAQVAELRAVQDVLMRLLSTTRPLSGLLEYYGATGAAEQALYGLLDEVLAATRGPQSRHPSFNFFQMRLGEIFPALRADRTFAQTVIDTLKVDRPAYRELHAYMAAHGWPRWD